MASSSFRSILVCIEHPDDPQQPAARRAAEIARQTGARLTLFHSAFDQFPVAPAVHATRFRQHVTNRLSAQRKALEGLAAKLRSRGVRAVSRVVLDYPPSEAIVRETLRTRPDLVIARSRRHRFGARMFLTNTDWELIRLCPAPLLFVKEKASYRRPRVLAAIDPLHPRSKASQLDRRILDAASGLTQALAGQMHVVHAHTPMYLYLPSFQGEGYAATVDADLEDKLEQIARRAMARATAPFGLPESRQHLDTGNAATVIPKVARRLKADIVVLGAVSRSAIGRLLIGATAERVLDTLTCDVLVVKARGFRTTVSRKPPRAEGPLPAI